MNISLERSGIFIIPLGDRRQWYRYHDLFRDMLRQRFHDRLSPEEQAEVYRRASAWYGDHDHIDQALQYALAGDDIAGAIHLVERHRISVMNQGNWRTLERWLEVFPEAVVQSQPSLLFTQGLVFNTTKVNWSSLSALKKVKRLPEIDETLHEGKRTELQAEIDALLAYDSFSWGSTSRRWRWPATHCNIYLPHIAICAASPWIFNAFRCNRWGARMPPFNS